MLHVLGVYPGPFWPGGYGPNQSLKGHPAIRIKAQAKARRVVAQGHTHQFTEFNHLSPLHLLAQGGNHLLDLGLLLLDLGSGRGHNPVDFGQLFFALGQLFHVTTPQTTFLALFG